MKNFIVFSSVFGVSEFNEPPNPNSYILGTYAFAQSTSIWYVVSIEYRNASKSTHLWAPVGYNKLPNKIRAYALVLGLPT